ncbi:LysR family transcriptional regulator [Rhodopseudomonas sp. AAP120]|jgi:DNA-binding transcriptional LysR family regulator|uniref:LysR family transcriptional regulator n=1 Tax=Rhodopseudomonas sp. AAP120 TaxID=1523430 RepID=UPI001FD8AFAF|nr:LysR family transcriptional regulator [Rhodopseudomonas sp. AAP120]
MKDFNSLDWDDLKVFLHAARGGSLGSAAKRLKVDQSTISRKIAHLESALGIALFERLPSGLRVTEVGDRLLCHTERIESAVIAMREDVQCGSSRTAGRVRLATMEGIASLYLAARFSRLRRQHPNLTVELLTSPQTVWVNRREADLFLSFFRPRGQGMVSERIGCFELGLYASQDYLDQHGTPQSATDLARHQFITYIDDLIQLDSIRWLDDIIKNPTVSFHSNSMIAQMNAAAGGLGLVLLPSFAAKDRDDLVPVLHDRMWTSRDVWINVHTDLQFVPRIRAVSSFLKATFKSDSIMQAAPPAGLSTAPSDGSRPRDERRPEAVISELTEPCVDSALALISMSTTARASGTASHDLASLSMDPDSTLPCRTLGSPVRRRPQSS